MATTIDLLNNISQQLDRYLGIIIFIFGTTGNILNCLVLSKRTLRTNPCALLFLVSSFINLIGISAGLSTRILAGWDLDPTTTNNSICKLRASIVFSSRTAAMWFITLATIDRWLLSSVEIHRRKMSSLRNTQRVIIIISIVSILAYAQMFYCYEANISDAPLKCYGKTEVCRLITDLVYAVITIVIPLVLMVIFGLLTISNVHRIHNRVAHIDIDTRHVHHGKQRNLHRRKTDHHLLRMLLLQVFVLVILCIPEAIQKFYVTFIPFDSESEVDDVVNTFLYNIEVLLAFIASGMPFYIYTLAGGSIFRKACMDLIRRIIHKMPCKLC